MTKASKPGRLRWRRIAPERGLRAITQGVRGSEYTDGVTSFATTQALRHRGLGWFWYARVGAAFENTAGVPVATEAEAKAAAETFVKRALKDIQL